MVFQGLKKKLQLRKLCWETMFGQELVSSDLLKRRISGIEHRSNVWKS